MRSSAPFLDIGNKFKSYSLKSDFIDFFVQLSLKIMFLFLICG